MPRPHARRYIPKSKPSVRDNLTVIWAMSPDAESDARVADYIARMGGVAPARDTSTHAKRGESNEAAGRKYERLTRRALEAEGYTVTKSQDSKGAADLVAYGPKGTRLVQVKSASDYTPGIANQGLRELLGLSTFKAVAVGPRITREVWAWMRGSDDKPLVIVRVSPKGRVTVEGGPAVEVAKEVGRMLEAWNWQP